MIDGNGVGGVAFNWDSSVGAFVSDSGQSRLYVLVDPDRPGYALFRAELDTDEFPALCVAGETLFGYYFMGELNTGSTFATTGAVTCNAHWK